MSAPAVHRDPVTPQPMSPRPQQRDQSWRRQPEHRPTVNAYERDRYQQQQAGTWAPFTGTGPVREHVDRLREAGMTSEQVACTSGVSVSTLTRLFKVTRMTASAADAILAVQPPERANPGRDPSRQLQGLVADGWHLEQLAATAGINERTAWQTLHGYTTPSARTAAAVEKVYEALKFEDPGDGAAAVRSRLRAKRQGWNPTTSEPDARITQEALVDQVAVDRAVHGDPVTLRPSEQQAALRRLAGGHSDDEIGRRLGVASRTVLRQRMSQGLPAYSPSSDSPTGPSR